MTTRGPHRTYWVHFDEPQTDPEGDGPYSHAQVLEIYLEELIGLKNRPAAEKRGAPGIGARPVTQAGLPVTTRVPPAVVVHIPHASLVVPDDVAAELLLTPEELEQQLLAMTDRYTDELFALPSTLATTVAFPVSRVVVDPERFTDDAREPMAGKGMGVIYTKTASGQPLRRPPTADERRHLLARFYEPHHAALTTAVETALGAHGGCLVLDGHSFPTRPQPYEDDQEPDRADICIGTDPCHTPDWLRDVAVRAFRELGWSVAINRPFAGALVPMPFYRKDLRVRAIMIEVKRGLYMDEVSAGRLPRFDEVRERLAGALRAVVGAKG